MNLSLDVVSEMVRSRSLRYCLPALLVGGLAWGQDSEAITHIEVVGAQKLTPETVIFKSGLKVGDDMRALDLTAVLQLLWKSGAFDDIKFEVSDEAGGKKLTIRVVERPLIKEVDYRGGTEIGISSIKDKVKEKKLIINPDSVYEPESARKIKGLIVELAAEKGFRNPVVDVALEPMSPGVARLIFDIKEGGKAKIYKIAFRGNRVISSGKLASAMEKTRRHWMFSWIMSHDLLVEKNLEEDLQNVKRAYWREGYKDVFVGQPTIEVEDRTSLRQKRKNETRIKDGKSPKYDLRATLTIPILEGEKFYEGKFKVEGNTKVFKGQKGEDFYRRKIAEVRRDNRSTLAKWLNLKPSIEDLPADKNRPFDLDGLNQGMEKIAEEHKNLAYIQWHADKKLEVREENGVKKVDTVLKVDEGELYTIRRINFEGNTTTKDKVLRRAMMIREGDPFRLEVFKDSYIGLGQLGFFDVKASDPKIDFVPDKPQVDITLKGEEAGVNEFMIQGGYGSVYGASVGASFSTKNLGGAGETLSFSVTVGKYQKNQSISFVEPYVLDLPYSVTASIGNGSVDYDASRVGSNYAYKQFTRSLGLAVGTRLSTFLPDKPWAFWTNYSVGYSFRVIRLEGGQNWYLKDTDNLLTSSINQSLAYSTVNHPFKPTRGTKISFGLEYGGWQMGSDRPFLRTNLEFAKFGNIAERHIFGINTSYGHIYSLGNDPLAVYDLYRPGGENSLRGYRYGQVGSIVKDLNDKSIVIGGNKQFLLNLEYQLVISDQARAVFFFDAGNAWASNVSAFSEPLRRSVGFEFRFFLPISPAPMRLIWSRKLNPYTFDTDSRNDFQFSIGTTF